MTFKWFPTPNAISISSCYTSSSAGIGNFYKPITRPKCHQSFSHTRRRLCICLLELYQHTFPYPVSQPIARSRSVELCQNRFGWWFLLRTRSRGPAHPAPAGFAQKRLLCAVVQRENKSLICRKTRGFLRASTLIALYLRLGLAL